jgi:hypothetical protein
MNRCDIKKHTFPILLSLIMVLTLISCSDNSGNDIMGPVEDVSFVNEIQPIFNGSCGGAGCHVGSTQSGVNLSSYDQVMSSTGQQYGREIVEPGSPDESPVVDKIEPNPQFGQRMPFGRGPLNSRQIEQIRVWIEEGALDN